MTNGEAPMTTDIRAEIRTGYFLNTIRKRCRYVNLLKIGRTDVRVERIQDHYFGQRVAIKATEDASVMFYQRC